MAGFFAARSLSLAEVLVDVVKLPPILVEGEQLGGGIPGDTVPGTGGPAFVIDRPVAEHLEILRGAAVLGLGVVKGVQDAHPLDRPLLDAVDDVGLGNADRLQHGGAMSMTWWNCGRTSPLALIPLGQWTIMPSRVPPKCDATCLHHWNGVLPAIAQPTAKWL